MTLTGKQSSTAQLGREAPDFDALFQQHWNRVCAVLFHLVGDWPEAEDLALETFPQFYRRPPPRNDNLGGWLYRVATHLGFNALRARRRRQHYEEASGYLLRPDDLAWDPAEELEQAQDRQRVQAVLEQMKPRAARLLVLRHSGLTYAELAAALEVAPASIGTLLARAEQEFEQRYRSLEK